MFTVVRSRVEIHECLPDSQVDRMYAVENSARLCPPFHHRLPLFLLHCVSCVRPCSLPTDISSPSGSQDPLRSTRLPSGTAKYTTSDTTTHTTQEGQHTSFSALLFLLSAGPHAFERRS